MAFSESSGDKRLPIISFEPGFVIHVHLHQIIEMIGSGFLLVPRRGTGKRQSYPPGIQTALTRELATDSLPTAAVSALLRRSRGGHQQSSSPERQSPAYRSRDLYRLCRNER